MQDCLEKLTSIVTIQNLRMKQMKSLFLNQNIIKLFIKQIRDKGTRTYSLKTLRNKRRQKGLKCLKVKLDLNVSRRRSLNKEKKLTT
jgi:hypothetical protein